MGNSTIGGGDRCAGEDDADGFLHRSGDGVDVILDFADGSDRLLLEGAATFSDASNVQVVGDGSLSGALASTAGGGRVLIVGVSAAQLGAAGTETIDGVLYKVFT